MLLHMDEDILYLKLLVEESYPLLILKQLRILHLRLNLHNPDSQSEQDKQVRKEVYNHLRDLKVIVQG